MVVVQRGAPDFSISSRMKKRGHRGMVQLITSAVPPVSCTNAPNAGIINNKRHLFKIA